MNNRVALSWSGGKDSCLALNALVEQGVEVACLITTAPAEIGRTFGHGEKTDLIRLQAKALSIPVEFVSCSFENYTERYVEELKRLKEVYGLTGIAFGDLYLNGHREWGEKAAYEAGVEAVYPLWMEENESIKAFEIFIESGYKAKVIRVREDVLDSSWLGRELDAAFLCDIREKAVCPMGESGEYHTFVYNGPLFSQEIQLESPKLVQLETTKKLEFEKYTLAEK
ncbi:diphthine--ammonia ligase [Bacillus sp. J33]|uniref:Dph6-related ATP pyrophosphatase n=1 Tax=Bacillus sp. J33 TaxID=935836 RepID=UPI00047C598D|nr:diphthine--ammonia ligase [Bacillus sp. J33]